MLERDEEKEVRGSASTATLASSKRDQRILSLFRAGAPSVFPLIVAPRRLAIAIAIRVLPPPEPRSCRMPVYSLSPQPLRRPSLLRLPRCESRQSPSHGDGRVVRPLPSCKASSIL